MAQILSAVTSNGSTTATWAGGNGTVFFEGTFDGAKVSLEWKKYGSTYYALDVATDVTYPVAVPFYLGACDIRMTVSGVGTSTDIDAGVE